MWRSTLEPSSEERDIGERGVIAMAAGMLQCTAVLRNDLIPVCPHCEAELPEIHVRRPDGPFGMGRGFVFFCPCCRKVLGFGTQWYPFPG
jgi:hypothetical protein